MYSGKALAISLGSGNATFAPSSWFMHAWSQIIGESVDSLCRDGADMPISQYKQNPSKLLTAEVLSLFRHLALILERFCTQQDSQSTPLKS